MSMVSRLGRGDVVESREIDPNLVSKLMFNVLRLCSDLLFATDKELNFLHLKIEISLREVLETF
jgi:hypothetical protein